jgi:hypothetical protein
MPKNSTESQHVFHTKHDFSPELGWAAFQLLQQAGDSYDAAGDAVEDEGLSVEELEELAHMVASPLAARSDGQKVVGALQDVGLVEREKGRARLSRLGRLVGHSVGRYEDGFRKAVHCLYFWDWLWKTADSGTLNAPATPSWSYRAVCRHILEAGPGGIERDDLVLRVVEDAQSFGATKVSFSRSSVTGVSSWLEAQRPPLIGRDGSRVVAHSFLTSVGLLPTSGTLRLHLAALCGLHSGEVVMDASALNLLSQALFIPPSGLMLPLADFCDGSDEFLLIRSVPPRLVSRDSADGLIRWMVGKNVQRSTSATHKPAAAYSKSDQS